jgi:hypothetical protein
MTTPCCSCKNRRLGGTYRLQLQGEKLRFFIHNEDKPQDGRGEGLATWCALSCPYVVVEIWWTCRCFHPVDGGGTFLPNVGFYKNNTASSSQRTTWFILPLSKHKSLHCCPVWESNNHIHEEMACQLYLHGNTDTTMAIQLQKHPSFLPPWDLTKQYMFSISGHNWFENSVWNYWYIYKQNKLRGP